MFKVNNKTKLINIKLIKPAYTFEVKFFIYYCDTLFNLIY